MPSADESTNESWTLPILGYASGWSVCPGESIQFMVSCLAEQYDVEIGRITGRGPRPPGEGGPLRWERVPSLIEGRYPGGVHSTVSGSYGWVDGLSGGDGSGVSLTAWIYPTLSAASRRQVILAWHGGGPNAGVELGLDDEGRLALWYPRRKRGQGVLVGAEALPERTWIFVGASVEAATGRVTLVRYLARPERGRERTVVIEATDGELGDLAVGPELFIAAAARAPKSPDAFASVAEGSYNGKVEWVAARPLALTSDQLVTGAVSRPARDLLGGANLVNAPMERMTGHGWNGRVLDWRVAPEEYEAVWFHDDDLSDARWPVALEWTVPSDIRTGMYGARISAGADEDVIPFYVRPGNGDRRSALAVLIPTFTYTIYSNFARPNRPLAPNVPPSDDVRAEIFINDHRELGLSAYCEHRDGSGVSHVSIRRPMVDMRPWHCIATRGNAGRELSGDLYLLDWLEAEGMEYDILTDHDLHAEGVGALTSYSAVVTGGHPEYCSEEILDAIQAYVDRGGNVAYLGGNGFYWVTTISPRDPDVLEVRRGRSGSRTWTGGPGEGYHTSGQPGGHWRDRGRAPQSLVGVGFSAQGGGPGGGYVRTEESEDPSVAFVFEGIGRDEVIGDFGLKLGAAAADEIDRADTALGTPPGTLVIATSAGLHDDTYQRAVEEVQEMNAHQGGSQSPYVRADMTYLETPGGGSVFSVGSISWSASLPFAGYNNNVARLTANVLNEFVRRLPPSHPAATVTSQDVR